MTYSYANLAVDTDTFLSDLGFPVGPFEPSKGQSFPEAWLFVSAA